MIGGQAVARKGRKRKTGAVRTSDGISRDYRDAQEKAYAASLAVRAAQLERERVLPSPKDRKDGIETFADNRLSGFTLGKLYLRYKTYSADPSGITGRQFSWGNRWCGIVHAHARIMGYRLSVKSPSFIMVAGQSGGAEPEPDEEEVMEIRRQFSDCYNMLMAASRDHGLRVRDITYGICIENWPIGTLQGDDIGLLRVGLNSVGKGLATVDGAAQISRV